MIRINYSYLDRFKKTKGYYTYTVINGVYLIFDENTLDYVGVDVVFTPNNYNRLNYKCEEKLVDLISKGLVEYYE